MLKYKKTKRMSLSREEEKKLFQFYQYAKDSKTKNDIVELYSGLVFYYAKKMGYRKNQLEDLIQEGFLGLNHAIEKYDTNFDCRFAFYAGYWIKACLLAFIYDNYSAVSMPGGADFAKAFWKIRKYDGFSREELASKLNLSIENVEILQSISRQSEFSLDEYYDKSNGNIDPYDKVSFKNSLNNVSITSFEEHIVEKQDTFFKLNAVNNRLVRDLKDQERDIILSHYMDNKTLKEIGKEYGLTRQRIEQIKGKALDKIKEGVREEIGL